ncbi:gamma-glutamyltransferase [Azospirillum agricola]|uniref:gamma-glutamyltransferase n=1 Tax=Azospirillum agricola TaxID=1720247 RepID=UPI000A0F2CAC|nr:gamma-glutamyltransferase [Azospirillum agricola]SMH51830.1 gamma-glutamyltranspeptidase / glutathione hydrolase [Azospirillum lipoferum]
MATTETSLLGLRTVTTSGSSERTPARPRRQSRQRIWRRWGAIAIAASLLPGCVNTKFKTDALIQSFAAASEPRAASIGREVLAQGGRAGDAAAAMGLALAASLPSRVGLTGGGVCVTFDAAKKEARTVDFLPRAAGTGGAAMPGLLRGLYIVQASLGVQRWEQLVAPAEQLAQFSPGVSRALVQDLSAFGSRLPADSEMRRRFLPNGAVPAVGTAISQPELAGTLSVIRRNGVGAFYGGPLAATVAQGLGLDPAALRAYQPRVAGTRSVPLGIVSMQFADTDLPESGVALIQAWNAAAELPPAQRAARVATALGATGGGSAVPGAGLMVIDQDQNGVACALTQGAPFGTGRSIPGTGLLGAQGVTSGGFGAPGLVTNAIVGRTLFAGVGEAAGNDGPAAGPAALLSVAMPAALEWQTAESIPVSGPGRVNFVACQVSTETGLRACQPATDPRGGGLAVTVETERPRE